jgi:hypothetical protein
MLHPLPKGLLSFCWVKPEVKPKAKPEAKPKAKPEAQDKT